MEQTDFGANWENFVKILLRRMDIPTREDIAHLHVKLDKLEQLIYQKQASGKPQPTKKKNASTIVLEIIGKHPGGTKFKAIKAATGFDDKKLRNIIFRLDKTKKIQRVSRGTYKKRY